jgi:hypothetical protein
MSPRRSNEERAKWRNKCRKVLSKHIGKMRCRGQMQTFTETSNEDRLGLLIEPAQVRLVPGLNDAYCWRYPPRLRRFFKRNMSDQTVGVYKALCREVEVTKSIKAVERDALAELGEWEPSEDEMSEMVWILHPHSPTDGELSLHRAHTRPSQTAILAQGQSSSKLRTKDWSKNWPSCEIGPYLRRRRKTKEIGKHSSYGKKCKGGHRQRSISRACR